MSLDNIYLSGDVVRDQKEIMVEKYGMDPDIAEEVFEDTKTAIMLQAQEEGVDWDDDTIEAVTNVTLAFQDQHKSGHMAQRTAVFMSFLRFVSLWLTLILGGLAVYTAMTGMIWISAMFWIFTLISSIKAARNV